MGPATVLPSLGYPCASLTVLVETSGPVPPWTMTEVERLTLNPSQRFHGTRRYSLILSLPPRISTELLRGTTVQTRTIRLKCGGYTADAA
ncbi:hypothetical protein DPMN_055597 [Dreissena polymorpha]|uniref:Uncharacterized protein n=1 Tax=Dreissena polymorpha TaxID=45954 RepID=A0A9D4CS49_DREPO|nr:hypothetical protein DPMN_055597 [Dreissena polymorpha]